MRLLLAVYTSTQRSTVVNAHARDPLAVRGLYKEHKKALAQPLLLHFTQMTTEAGSDSLPD